MEFLYESPAVLVMEMAVEGVLCASRDDDGVDMNPEFGNM